MPQYGPSDREVKTVFGCAVFVLFGGGLLTGGILIGLVWLISWLAK